MRPGVRLAVDLGEVRVGVARCDATASLASPLAVLAFTDLAALAVQLQTLIAEHSPLEVLIGLPIDLKGLAGPAAIRRREQAVELARQLPGVAIRLVDERLTTAAARKLLQSAGHDSRADRQLIDAAAATVLLEDALEAERRQGVPPGELLQ